MAEMHVVSQLATKRSELMGDLEYYRARIKATTEDIAAVDRSIHLFDPDYPLEKIRPRRKTSSLFASGELKRTVLDVLRNAGEALSTSSVVEAVANVKDIDRGEKEKMETLTVSTRNALFRLGQEKTLERVGEPKRGMENLWRIAS